MQSRRDQIQAHTFIRERLASGVIQVDPDGMDQPVTRTRKGTVLGVVLAGLGSVVVLLLGVVLPSASSAGWQKTGTLVIDSDTGAEYMYANGQLHPALNATSARLIAGSQLNVATASDASLRGTPRGVPFGIVGAPDAPPTSAALSRGAWVACGLTVVGAANAAPEPELVLSVGQARPQAGLTIEQGVLVTGDDRTEYLLWNGERLRLDTPDGAVQALGYAALTPTPVTASFLDAVPSGPDLAAPAITGLGDAGPELAGTSSRVGQLYGDGQGRHYLLTASGLAPLTSTLFALISEDPVLLDQMPGGGARDVLTLSPQDLIEHSAPSALSGQRAALPQTPPKIMSVQSGQAVCDTLILSGNGIGSTIGIADAGVVSAGASPPQLGTGVVASCLPADKIAITPGTGVLAAAEPAGGGAATTYYLVADNGVKYPIASAAALGQLGYNATSAVLLPEPVVGLLPTGPSLDPTKLDTGGVVEPPSPHGSCLS